MTANNNNAFVWIVVALIGLMLVLAFRSIFFVLPFGAAPGISHVIRDTGHSMWWAGTSSIVKMALILLPLALLALWVYVLLWVYHDAEKRGMSGILWALLVFVGHVIGLIIYLIMRSEKPVRKAETGPAPAAECCPGCGKPVAAGHVFCPACGRPRQTVCPACKKPAEAGWKVCPYCGTGLDSGKSEQA
ncbi:MAG: zinc ribbon domain-containing protein [Acidobacteriota bacterium]